MLKQSYYWIVLPEEANWFENLMLKQSYYWIVPWNLRILCWNNPQYWIVLLDDFFMHNAEIIQDGIWGILMLKQTLISLQDLQLDDLISDAEFIQINPLR